MYAVFDHCKMGERLIFDVLAAGLPPASCVLLSSSAPGAPCLCAAVRHPRESKLD
jgi:hypothetical protein